MGALAVLAVCAFVTFGPIWARGLPAYLIPERAALRAALADPAMADIRPAYAYRGFRPIWIRGGKARPEARELVSRIAGAGEDGLDPAEYGVSELQALLETARRQSRPERARGELRLSRAYAEYLIDLHTPTAEADLVFTDPALSPGRPTLAVALRHLVRARSIETAIEQAVEHGAVYAAFRKALEDHRAQPAPDPQIEQLLLANLERARALPAHPGERYVLVDAAGGRLLLYENDEQVDEMKVIVGTPQQQTPAMAGLIRYSVFNPSWNVPPDLTRATYAPRIAANLDTLRTLQMDVWSDHTPRAVLLDPRRVNWPAVSRGEQFVWLRQRPGRHNAMGAVKFMLPNTLGIYLHDTYDESLFARDIRTFSAGCVRVEDHERLARWLYGRPMPPGGAGADQRIDLSTPTPVYIAYFTVWPGKDGLEVRRDVYDRDRALIAEIASGPKRRAAQPAAVVRELEYELPPEVLPPAPAPEPVRPVLRR